MRHKLCRDRIIIFLELLKSRLVGWLASWLEARPPSSAGWPWCLTIQYTKLVIQVSATGKAFSQLVEYNAAIYVQTMQAKIVVKDSFLVRRSYIDYRRIIITLQRVLSLILRKFVLFGLIFR